MNNQVEIDFFENPEYEERADYLTETQLSDWFAQSKNCQKIQSKLIQIGAKLLVGPRGTGKTHQMRQAYYTCKNDNKKPLSIYVTFNHYLRLESYLHDESNAMDIFHAWVLAKIAVSCIEDYGVSFESDSLNISTLKTFIVDIERSKYDDKYSSLLSELTVYSVQNLIGDALSKVNRKRAIVLLDDAALTLTHDYMVEFFDVFRSLKSSKISPKASVYPGTTQYGPRFHADQDAEIVSVWMNVEDNDYLPFMLSTVDHRISKNSEISQEINHLLIYASFGIPRTYITLIRAYLTSEKKQKQSKFNDVIQQRCRNIITEYNSIQEKLPQYKNIISIGDDFFVSILEALKDINHKNIDQHGDQFKKTITIGIEEINQSAERMIKFLIEAGILYEQNSISNGPNRKIRRFTPHLSFVIKERILTKSRGFNVANLVSVFDGPSEKHATRKKFNSLIPNELINNLRLDLPPCNICNTPRIAEGQKYCHICGNQLADGSIFKSCISKDLSELPFTDFQHRVISSSKFKTVEDVLVSENTAAEFMKIRGVGTFRSSVIIKKISSWINEFLY